jgi:hypothetical protein
VLLDDFFLDGRPKLPERALGEAAEFGKEGIVVLCAVSEIPELSVLLPMLS